ncbi:uncharacterized protein LOC125777901 [Bactrocera dorsalis]|uniref:Uncharacterized protein LOC125777901 n=1 Tax=Bactrocera dorsalis TaxID=27457 RepID=A0ABM3JLB3_BACDO|nr:uncharacterized protein LOC125777901 [Bactrocera dorsalis]
MAVSGGSSGVEYISTQNVSPRLPLPSMSEDNIEAYFYSLGFWFEASRVFDDSVKFNIVLASVPPAKLIEMRNIIDDTPLTDKYGYIRRKIIDIFAESQQRRLQRVLKELPLGNRRPRELYHEMRRTAGPALRESILHDLWVSRLPPYAQAAIIATNAPIGEKIKIADSISECLEMKVGNQICEVSTEPSFPDEWSNLRAEVAALTKQVNQFMRNSRTQQRSRSSSASRSRRGTLNVPCLCWYHTKFGANVTKCRQPTAHIRRLKTSSRWAELIQYQGSANTLIYKGAIDSASTIHQRK